MNTGRCSARARTALLQRALDGGRHRIDIKPDGTATILPLGASVAHADEVALDAEIQGLIDRHGHAPH